MADERAVDWSIVLELPALLVDCCGPPALIGLSIGWEERFEPQFLQCHVLRRPERHDGAEEAKLEIVFLDMKR